MNKKLYLFLIYLSFGVSISAQPVIDSLNRLIQKSSQDYKIELYNDLAEAYFDISLDLTIKNAQIAIQKADELAKDKSVLKSLFDCTSYIRRQTTDISETTKANSFAILGEAYFYLDDLENSLTYFEKSLEINLIIGTKDELASAYNNLGIVYSHTNNNEKALESYEKALVLKRELKDRKAESSSLNNIGVLYELHFKKYYKAVKYYYAS